MTRASSERTWRWAVVLSALVVLPGCGCVVGSQQGYEPVQPLEYSHALHAGQYQIDCKYCHFGAEHSRHAGVPPVQVCMNCHTQVKKKDKDGKDSPLIARLAEAYEKDEPIEWIKVHRLPDHAYFNHASHVVTGKVQCQTCHGPVETMVRVQQVERMTMGWCLDCHRTMGVPEAKNISPTTDCSGCHR